MTQDEIIEMAKESGFWQDLSVYEGLGEHFKAFAKLVAAKAIAKDREEFDIDELCARQNKIGYKQGYRAGQLYERDACAKLCEEHPDGLNMLGGAFVMCASSIRARSQQ